MELSELLQRVGPFVAIPALLAFILLLPLFVSQRRDIARLRAWRESQPDHPVADLRASEAILDRAELELERLQGEATGGTAIREPDAGAAPPVTAAAARVATERPALERITMERAALDPHSRWRRVANRLTQSRVLIAIALACLLAGGGAIVASERLLSGGPSGESAPAALDPSDVTVSVLNGTAVAGLAGKVQSDVAASGYEIDTVGAAPAPAERTTVMFRRGQRPAAVRVALDIGVRERDVVRMDPPTRRLAGDAGVVVVAGEDRAR